MELLRSYRRGSAVVTWDGFRFKPMRGKGFTTVVIFSRWFLSVFYDPLKTLYLYSFQGFYDGVSVRFLVGGGGDYLNDKILTNF